MRETLPMSICCGLPVIVATLPMFDPVASARRTGSGLSRRNRVTSMTTGVSTRHTGSLTNSAESRPAAADTAKMSAIGLWTRHAT
jgi:hypothetical protein